LLAIAAGEFRLADIVTASSRLQTSRARSSPLARTILTTVYFERMMVANGLKKGDYDTLPTGVAAARFAALQAGVVDAAIVLVPLYFQAAAAGLADCPHPLPHFR
jgi:hypothetical protein